MGQKFCGLDVDGVQWRAWQNTKHVSYISVSMEIRRRLREEQKCIALK
jgi:hypothetical protein